jgi:hypothetical protein
MKGNKWIAVLMLGIFALSIVSAAPDPSGATLTPGASSRGTNPGVSTANAQAGNVTQLDIDQTRITDIWQGFFGSVSGQIVLENSAGANFYDWTLAAITGEVYATRNTVTDWTGINCSNSTHWEEEETELNIISASVDGINETYSAYSHPSFQVGTKQFATNVCPSVRPFNGTASASQFYNVMLNSNATNSVYTVILAENQNAFDNSTADFEVLVPADRTSGLATYYFYVELN